MHPALTYAAWSTGDTGVPGQATPPSGRRKRSSSPYYPWGTEETCIAGRGDLQGSLPSPNPAKQGLGAPLTPLGPKRVAPGTPFHPRLAEERRGTPYRPWAPGALVSLVGVIPRGLSSPARGKQVSSHAKACTDKGVLRLIT